MARRYGTSGGATFRVEGIEPSELQAQPEAVRRMYWRWVVELVLTAKDRELAAGLDRFGMMLVPISAHTMRYRRSVKGAADPNAPPLQPAHELSRTRSLFRGRAFPNRAEFYWGFDEFTGASWGRVLKFHARGQGHLPVRDVIGLSPQSLQWVRAQALGRWGAWLHAKQTAPGYRPPRKTAPTPKGWAIGATKAKEVPKIEPTGHTNLDNYTFGIGASKDEVRRMIDSGHFTGFRQLHTFKPGTGPSAGPQPPPPAPRPKPAPKPKPSPKAGTYDLEVSGNVPADIVENHRKAIEAIPAPVLKVLKDKGLKFAYTEKLTDRYPQLAGEHPSGWTAGLTWDHSDGIFANTVDEITVSRTKKVPGLDAYVVSRRQRGVLFHETYHGVDQALGFPSRTQEWSDAHKADVANLTDELKAKFAYFLQPSYRGWEETFAELGAWETGEGSMTHDIRPFFPKTLAVLRSLVEALK